MRKERSLRGDVLERNVASHKGVAILRHTQD